MIRTEQFLMLIHHWCKFKTIWPFFFFFKGLHLYPTVKHCERTSIVDCNGNGQQFDIWENYMSSLFDYFKYPKSNFCFANQKIKKKTVHGGLYNYVTLV